MKDEIEQTDRRGRDGGAAVRIRDVSEADLPGLAAMVAALAADHGEVSQLGIAALARDVLGPQPWLSVLVAEGVAGLLGYAALCPRAQLQLGLRGMDLHHLYVAPVARGKGLGRRLIAAAAERARARGCGFLTVATASGNWHAQTVYRACGFEPVPQGGGHFRMALAAPA